jgi:hypothetical protein
LPMLRMISRTTVVLPEPLPPATPMMTGCMFFQKKGRPNRPP